MDAKCFFILLQLYVAVNCGIIETKPAEEEQKSDNEVVFFSERWTQIYSSEQLQQQAKWTLAENQPEDGSYEVRQYQGQWWVKSHRPCASQLMSTSHGYMALYFYYHGFNYRGLRFNLTYPILSHVDKRPLQEAEKVSERTPKRPIECPIRFSTFFYLPIADGEEPPETDDASISALNSPITTRYVLEYFGNYTGEFCNEKAAELAQSLTDDGISYDAESWQCATYLPGVKESKPRYEVWVTATKIQTIEPESGEREDNTS